MTNFSVCDAMLDAVFIINKDKRIVYCNDTAADLCESSVKRMIDDKYIFDLVSIENSDLFMFGEGKKGLNEISGYEEVELEVNETSKKFKVNICVLPVAEVDGEHWAIFCHDVTVEERLHSKHLVQLKKLESYSKGLEQKVEERTSEYNDTYNLMKAMLNSLGQGFLVINSEGNCGDVYTKSCATILECNPAGKHLSEVLSIKKGKLDELNLWIKTMFKESLPFDSLRELGPTRYEHSQDNIINLDFYPIRGEDEKIEFIVMVATDKTEEHKAYIEMEREKMYSQMILKVVKNKDQFSQFLGQLDPKINRLVKFTKADDENFIVDDIIRFLHTIEGEAGIFSIEVIREHSRRCQQILEPLKTGWVEDPAIIRGEFNVEVAKMAYDFENFMRKNTKTFRSLGIFGNKKIEIDEKYLNGFYDRLKSSKAPAQLINEFKNGFIYQPIKRALVHYEDLIKLIAARQGKEIPNVEFIGCETKVDARIYSGLFDSLVHVFRNSVDHGLEMAEERKAFGKPPVGTISIECSIFKMEREYLKISIRDDGRGVDPEMIKETLKARGFDLNFDEMSSYDLIQQVFLPGYSSRAEIGEFSGRGVGMDAIKGEVLKLNGEISFKSIPGNGSTLTILIPVGETDSIRSVA